MNFPRVAGIVTTVQQTPLSHVNPARGAGRRPETPSSANALQDNDIAALVSSYVHYTVTDSGYTFRAATRAEVDAHYAASRPATTQTSDAGTFSVTAITPLSQVGFHRLGSVRRPRRPMWPCSAGLGFPAGTVPDGFAIPFHFYDEFMKASNLYDDVQEMLADEGLPKRTTTSRRDELKKLRKKIKDAAHAPNGSSTR